MFFLIDNFYILHSVKHCLLPQFKLTPIPLIQELKGTICQVNHGLNLTTMSHLKLTVKLLMLIFTEILYCLQYDALITENCNVKLIIITDLGLLLHSRIHLSNL